MNACHVSISRPRTPTQDHGQAEALPSEGSQSQTRLLEVRQNHEQHQEESPLPLWTDSDDEMERATQNMGNTYVRIIASNGEQSSRSSLGLVVRLDPEEQLRRKVAFFFMDPVKKFIARRQAPWKLIIQFLKIILVTVQLIIFGNYRYAHSNYYGDNEIGFEHLFLKNWDSVREINSYPPTSGAYALYKRATFYDMFNTTADTYFNLDNITINPIYKNSSLFFCLKSFISDENGYKVPIYNSDTERFMTTFKCLEVPIQDLSSFNSESYLRDHNFEIDWDILEHMFINFTVSTVTYRQMGPLIGPDCFKFNIRILFDNSDHDGQITISLQTVPTRVHCPRNVTSNVNSSFAVAIRLLDYAIIVNCVFSFILCCRALFRAQFLCCEVQLYFKNVKCSALSAAEKFQFLNLWYIIICVNDVLIIIGSVLKELIELRETTGDLWNFCSILLGSGSLLVWIGMLRYLGFFDTYNMLILTLKGAFPNVIRFMICAGIVYLGYTFCGWVVLGPFHYKFKTLESTSECLFSLINGDDMFATFNMISDKSSMIHGFTRVYLYSFVTLFIYVILSLFIAIIMDTYEVIKEYYKKGFPKSRIDEFYLAGNYDHYSNIFLDGSAPSLMYRLWAAMMISICGESWRGYPRERANRQQIPHPDVVDDSTPILT